MIHFKHPSVSPVNEEEEKVFAELEQPLSSGMMSFRGQQWLLQRGEKRLWQLRRACDFANFLTMFGKFFAIVPFVN